MVEVKEKKVQLLMKVPEHVKTRFQQEADLAYEYNWIAEPTMTQLFIWVVDSYLNRVMKQYIKQRRSLMKEQSKEG